MTLQPSDAKIIAEVYAKKRCSVCLGAGNNFLDDTQAFHQCGECDGTGLVALRLAASETGKGNDAN